MRNIKFKNILQAFTGTKSVTSTTKTPDFHGVSATLPEASVSVTSASQNETSSAVETSKKIEENGIDFSMTAEQREIHEDNEMLINYGVAPTVAIYNLKK